MFFISFWLLTAKHVVQKFSQIIVDGYYNFSYRKCYIEAVIKKYGNLLIHTKNGKYYLVIKTEGNKRKQSFCQQVAGWQFWSACIWNLFISADNCILTLCKHDFWGCSVHIKGKCVFLQHALVPALEKLGSSNRIVLKQILFCPAYSLLLLPIPREGNP